MKRFLTLLVFSLACMSAFAQIQLSGTVTDNKGVSLPGVSILVEGTKTGALSNSNGQYSITVPNANSVLVFSFLGFVPQSINVKGRSQLNVSLTEDSRSLNEVVVLGYGSTQKKASAVSAIANVNMKELRTAAPSNLTNTIAGRVPGIIARMGDGSPGGTQTRYSNGDVDDAQVYLRGRASLNSQSALILIDGVEGSMSRINPEDIEQFSVLKDASATAVYGVRGANGVILITTKRGAVGAPKISVSSQFRMMKPLAFPEFLGSYDYAMLYNEAQKNENPTATPRYDAVALEAYRTGSDPYKYPDVNWRDVLLKDNFMEQQHIANINGGTDKVKYYISGEYNLSGGLQVGSKANSTDYNYRRYNLRTNLDFAITKTTEILVKVNGRLNDLNFAAKGESSGQRVAAAAWSDITARSPNQVPVFNPNGTYAMGPANLPNNPLADLMEGGYIRRLGNTLESNFTVNQKLNFITPGLNLRGMYAVSFGSSSTKTLGQANSTDLWLYNPDTKAYSLSIAQSPTTYGLGSAFNDFGRVQQIEATLSYDKSIAQHHKISAMATAIHTTNEVQVALPIMFRGLAGRLTYGYKDKYLIEGNIGYNGSDAFNKSNRYAFFPAAAIGWVPSEEKFFKDNIKFVDFLKFRASYGEVGNDRIGTSFRYLYQYNFLQPTGAVVTDPNAVPGSSTNALGYYSLGTNATQMVPLFEGTLGNDLVTWETARKTDIGMEAKFFKSRLSFEADVFLEERDDILRQRNDLPEFSGLSSSKLPALNVGSVTNKGYELALSFSDNIGGFGFTVGGNYTFVRNTINYMAEQPREYDYQYQTGKSIGLERMYIWTGNFYSAADLANTSVPKPVPAPRAGELMFQDLNNDGLIDIKDQAVTGYSQIPEKMFGANLNMDYKNFYVSTFWQGASNVSIRPSGPMRLEFGGNTLSYNVQPFHMRDRWVYDPSRGLDTRSTAKYPILIPGGATYTQQVSTFHSLNGEYLRLKTAEFGYNFPEAITKKLRVADLRVFLSGSNLITFSHLKKYNLDPEYLGSSIPGQDATNGLGSGAYSPQNKFYAFGLNVTF